MNKAKLFKNGQSQAVRLPKEFRFEEDEVYIKRQGKIIILFAVDNPWEPLLDSLSHFSDDFMATRDQPTQQVRESL